MEQNEYTLLATLILDQWDIEDIILESSSSPDYLREFGFVEPLED